MTKEQKIRVLAELDGWKQHHEYPDVLCWFIDERLIEECDVKDDRLTDYLTSYDAIIPLIQKQPLAVRQKMCHDQTQFPFTFTQSIMATPEQLSDALIKAVGKWEED